MSPSCTLTSARHSRLGAPSAQALTSASVVNKSALAAGAALNASKLGGVGHPASRRAPGQHRASHLFPHARDGQPHAAAVLLSVSFA
jgi:hypothetical protein